MVTDGKDKILLAELRRVVVDADPLPAFVLAAAEAAIETRHLNGSLVRLVADSTRDDLSVNLEAVRAAGADQGQRMLLYAGGDVRIDMAVHPQGAMLLLMGRIESESRVDLVLEDGGGSQHEVVIEDPARFMVTGVAPGPIRLRCHTAAGDTVLTEWVTV